MNIDRPEREGILLLRVWVEDHPDHPLRAVMTTWSHGGLETSTASVSAEQVAGNVRSWLQGLLDG